VNEVGDVHQQTRWRLVAGLIAAVIFVLALVARVYYKVQVDEVAVALLVCVIGSILFALSQRLGISKISAGPLEVEMPLVEQAVAELPSGQEAREVWRVLNKHSGLFPVIGVRLLWVDDRPETLIPHRRLLRRLGAEVVTVTSTDAAKAEIERDGDFALIIQDRFRHHGVEDARALTKWVETDGLNYSVRQIPLVVFTWDVFDESIGAKERNWITKDFASLVDRIANEVQHWKKHSPPASVVKDYTY
jgi:CheY-like chemotaxis protein